MFDCSAPGYLVESVRKKLNLFLNAHLPVFFAVFVVANSSQASCALFFITPLLFNLPERKALSAMVRARSVCSTGDRHGDVYDHLERSKAEGRIG